MIFIEVNGKKYYGFKSCKITIDIECACRAFEFVTTSQGVVQTPIKQGDKVGIWINKNKKITGYVDMIDPEWDSEKHEILISGRSNTCDIVDSTVTDNIDIAAPISLVNIFYKVLKHLNITDIKVILNQSLKSFQDAELNGKQDNEFGEIVSAPIACNAFDFLEKFCKKRQVLFTCDGLGNIILARAGEERLPIALIHQVNGSNNNVLRAGAKYDNSKRFWKYIVHSQANNADSIDEGYESVTGIAYDEEIRHSRILEIQAEVSNDIQTAKDRATWEANIRRARSFVYNATVSKFCIDAAETREWDVNYLVPVVDEYEDINSTLLIRKVVFIMNDNGDETTELELVTKDAMTLQASENAQLTALEKKGKALRSNITTDRGL